MNSASPFQSPVAQPELPAMSSSYCPASKTATKSLLLNSPIQIGVAEVSAEQLSQPSTSVRNVDKSDLVNVKQGDIAITLQLFRKEVQVLAVEFRVTVEVAEDAGGDNNRSIEDSQPPGSFAIVVVGAALTPLPSPDIANTRGVLQHLLMTIPSGKTSAGNPCFRPIRVPNHECRCAHPERTSIDGWNRRCQR